MARPHFSVYTRRPGTITPVPLHFECLILGNKLRVVTLTGRDTNPKDPTEGPTPEAL